MNIKKPLQIIHHCDSVFNSHIIRGEGQEMDGFEVQLNKQCVSYVKKLFFFPYKQSFPALGKRLRIPVAYITKHF